MENGAGGDKTAGREAASVQAKGSSNLKYSGERRGEGKGKTHRASTPVLQAVPAGPLQWVSILALPAFTCP